MSPEWEFEELEHAGAEHLDPAQVRRYDEKIPFDPSREIEILLEHGLSQDDTVVDFGTGTGEFPLAVAPHCHRVVGVDISESMLAVAQEKIEAEGIGNIELVHDGFLTYDHAGDPASFVFSKNTLHHLPDFWKVEALKTVAATQEPGGTFRLRDLVYSFAPERSRREIESWLGSMGSTPFTEAELQAHFREEFSTYDSLLEPMLEHAGFEILESDYQEEFYAAYTCEWVGT